VVRRYEMTTREEVGSVGTQTGAIMILDPAFLETADEAGYWLEATPESDYATVGPLDQRGELGLERVFFLLAGVEGVAPVFAVRDLEGRVVRLEIDLDVKQ
jgi:hypothetical protein